MSKVGMPYTSGNWIVREGNEETFLETWRTLAEVSSASAGARQFFLIRDSADPRHFISFGRWDDFESVSASRSRRSFLEAFRACQSLCEEFGGGDYEVVIAVPDEGSLAEAGGTTA